MVKTGTVRGVIERASIALARTRLRRLGGGNRLDATSAVLDVSFAGRGTGNLISVDPGAVLRGTRITIRGDGNVLRIGSGVRMSDGDLWLEGDGCTIEIGDGSSFEPRVKLAAVEDGRRIVLGEGCMFSEDVQVRTSDSHPIYDEHGVRINGGEDVTFGDRVWIGNRSFVLKGVTVASDSIVGACSVVTRSSKEPGVVLAGAPATVVRRGVTWGR